MVGSLGGAPVAWETYDFSVGAYDSSAWADLDPDSKRVKARLMGYLVGKPDERPGRIFAIGETGKALRKGKARKVEVKILQGEDLDGPRLSSEGQRAEMRIDHVGPQIPDSYNRKVTGRIKAKLCPIDWPGQKCQNIELTFDTLMQVESTLPIVAD
ncbi:hypothetical protein Q9295_14980 [Xinfangfangia sp. CPCC 101601]|uniref:Uncharacterized protein n=1 Tax=Pseudogemmobacter lacusdianii TaxID=3069608 RepID=A0ABU0W135_9RHOB|nr:hypothetical protein [Xinfangfangia sp. CPCC 101601]MDQ2067679.1 hypothetical protein [Xinfangfangia sp. CPCC 101601]